MRSSMGPSKLFVGEIGDNRKSDISRLFSKYGEISTIYVDDNKHFAFVEFTSSSDAQHALKHTHNKTVNGAKLRVEYAKPDRPPRDNNRRGLSREHTPTAALYNRLQVTANRLPTMPTIRQNYYQHHPSNTMVNSAMSRGRSLTPPSLKQHPRLSSMNHLQAQDFYPSYYPPHPAMYADSAYYRTYGDPYLMQRLPPPPPPPPPDFLPTTSSSSRAYRHMYSSSDLDRYPPVMSHRRTQQSRSRSRRRRSTSRKNRFSRERKRKRRTPSSSSPQQQRERGPQTPPPPPPPSQPQSSSSHRSKKRERSESDTVASVSEQKSSSSSVSDDEGGEDKQSHSKRSPDDDSDRKHSKRRMKK